MSYALAGSTCWLLKHAFLKRQLKSLIFTFCRLDFFILLQRGDRFLYIVLEGTPYHQFQPVYRRYNVYSTQSLVSADIEY